MPYVALQALETRSSGNNYALAIMYQIGQTIDTAQFTAGDLTALLAIGAISGP